MNSKLTHLSFSYKIEPKTMPSLSCDAVLGFGLALRARPPPSTIGGDISAHFELRGVELGQGASRLGLLPGAKDLVNDDILRFFWGEQERRLAGCMLHHGRLGIFD